MEAGHLVSDDIILGVVRDELAKPEAAKGVIFDGVVRTIPQAEGMERILADKGRKMDAVLFFDVTDEEILSRLTSGAWRWSTAPTTTRRPWRPGCGPTASRRRRSWPGTRRGTPSAGFPPPAPSTRSPTGCDGPLAASMITLKSPREIEAMARAGRIVAGTLALMREIVRPGLSTEDLDAAAERFIRSHEGARPRSRASTAFPRRSAPRSTPRSSTASPRTRRVLGEGSIVSVDVGVQLEGLHADSATTLPVGRISPEAERLLSVTQECLVAGIAQARAGNHVGDIGHAVQQVAEGAGYGVVRELVGHGIGTRFHEEPQVPNYGSPKRGPLLREGMTLAIEPMITIGSPVTKTLGDKWTVVTADGSLSAHFEHTVAITADGPMVLTAA